MQVFKGKFYLSFILLFMAACFIATDIEAANIWPTASATVCWTITADGGGSGVLRLRSMPMGSGNYLISGKMVVGGKIVEVINGNAITSMSDVKLTLNSAGRNTGEAMWTSTYYVVLSGTTLNGTFEYIGHDRSYVDLSVDTEYGKGTLTKITCP